jgi:DNA-binding NarL/FixJ family response regulator
MLSEYELNLYKLLVTPLSVKGIAEEMKISESYVQALSGKLYRKLSVTNRVELMAQEINFLRVQQRDVKYAQVS